MGDLAEKETMSSISENCQPWEVGIETDAIVFIVPIIHKVIIFANEAGQRPVDEQNCL